MSRWGLRWGLRWGGAWGAVEEVVLPVAHLPAMRVKRVVTLQKLDLAPKGSTSAASGLRRIGFPRIRR